MTKKYVAILLTVVLIVGAVIVGNKVAVSDDDGWKESVIRGGGREKIVQININGPLLSEINQEGVHPVISMLNRAAHDQNVIGIVLNVNTPGGDVVTVDHIYSKIVELKEMGKTVVVSMGSIAASGGYYISAPVDHIFANPSTITGSLGVIISFNNYQALAEKLGYSELTIKSGPYKDIGDPMKKMSNEEIEIYQTIINESYQQFVKVIASGRGIDEGMVLEIADGRVYSGRQALELGLVDQLGTLEDAIRYIKEVKGIPSPQIVGYSKKSNLLKIMEQRLDSPNLQETAQSLLQELRGTGPTVLYMLN